MRAGEFLLIAPGPGAVERLPTTHCGTLVDVERDLRGDGGNWVVLDEIVGGAQCSTGSELAYRYAGGRWQHDGAPEHPPRMGGANGAGKPDFPVTLFMLNMGSCNRVWYVEPGQESEERVDDPDSIARTQRLSRDQQTVDSNASGGDGLPLRANSQSNLELAAGFRRAVDDEVVVTAAEDDSGRADVEAPPEALPRRGVSDDERTSRRIVQNLVSSTVVAATAGRSDRVYHCHSGVYSGWRDGDWHARREPLLLKTTK